MSVLDNIIEAPRRVLGQGVAPGFRRLRRPGVGGPRGGLGLGADQRRPDFARPLVVARLGRGRQRGHLGARRRAVDAPIRQMLRRRAGFGRALERRRRGGRAFDRQARLRRARIGSRGHTGQRFAAFGWHGARCALVWGRGRLRGVRWLAGGHPAHGLRGRQACSLATGRGRQVEALLRLRQRRLPVRHRLHGGGQRGVRGHVATERAVVGGGAGRRFDDHVAHVGDAVVDDRVVHHRVVDRHAVVVGDVHAAVNDGRCAGDHRRRRADGGRHDQAQGRARRRRHEHALGPQGQGAHHAGQGHRQRQAQRGGRRHKGQAGRAPKAVDKHDGVAAVLIVGLDPQVARARRRRPVAGRPDPAALPGPVAAHPHGIGERRGRRRLHQHGRRRPGHQQGRGLHQGRFGVHADDGGRLAEHRRRGRCGRRAVGHGLHHGAGAQQRRAGQRSAQPGPLRLPAGGRRTRAGTAR